MPYKFKAVSAQTKLLIDYSNKVIQKCRAIVAMGAGNQRDDVRRTQGRANYLSRVTQSDPNYVWNRPLRSGSVTCAYGSGTCQDQSGVTYTILRSKLNNTHTISLCVHNAIGHQFATIGIPGIDPANEVVCVDPWPIRCQAVLLEDHFCWPGLTVLRSKPAGKQASYQTRLQKWAPPNATAVRQYADAHVWPVQVINAGINSGFKMFTHRYCTEDESTIVYRVRAMWTADSQRPQCHGCNKDFSPIRWQHHCRSCGEIFCDDCSKGRTVVGIPATEPGKPVVDLSNGSVRVCAPCLNQINTPGFGG